MSDRADELLQRAVSARRELLGDVPDTERRRAEALNDLRQAAAVYRESGRPERLAVALKASGQLHRDAGDSATALPYYREAADIDRAGDRPLALAHSLRHVADVLCELERGDEAEPLYDEALTLYRSAPETSQLELANAVRPLALLCEQRDRAEQARALWSEALALYSAAGIDAGVAESREHLDNLKTD